MTISMWRPPAALMAVGCLVLAGCSVEADVPAANPQHRSSVTASDAAENAGVSASAAGKTDVSIDNFTYSPQVLTVAVGTKVTWLNRDDVPHTVTSPTKPRVLESGTLDTDQSFSHVFTKPGTYEYFCAVHPKMTGKIIVK